MDSIIDEYPNKKYFNQYIYDKALEHRARLDPYYQEFVGNDWDNPMYEEGMDEAKRNKVYFYFLISALLNKSVPIDLMLQHKPDGKQLNRDILSLILNNRKIHISIDDLQYIAENKKTVHIDDYFQKMFDNYKLHESVDEVFEDIRDLFLILIKNEHFDSAKYLAGQVPIVEVLSTIKSAEKLKNLLDNPDIVSIIGKDAVQELRKGLVKLAPKKYIELQSQASVLKEIGGEPDYERREISRGTVHDHVIANILSGSISTFGLYNVMQAIENAPKNVVTPFERRDWSVLRHLSKKKKKMLAEKILPSMLAEKILPSGKLTTAQFVDMLDLMLRVLSNPDDKTWKENPEMKLKYIQDYQNANVPFNMTTWAYFQMPLVFNQYYFILAIKSIVKSSRQTHPTIVSMKKYISANYVYPLPGLEGLVVEIDKIGIEKWIKQKFPYVTQFQGYDMFAESTGDFQDFE